MKTCSLFLLFGIVLLGFYSCGSSKDIEYYQGPEDSSSWDHFLDRSKYEIRIVPNDNLLITVSAENPQAVEMFNTIKTERMTTISEYQGYLVDQEGCINFPGVGNMKVSGMTKGELIDRLQEKIKPMVNNPVVNVRFMNFKVTVQGEVVRPGVYSVSNERITVPEALALAGDLTINGVRQDVLLCRMINGEKKIFHIDLTSPEVFYSPYFYLEQNDILYVKPNKAKVGTSTSLYRDAPLFISSISLIITIVALFVK